MVECREGGPDGAGCRGEVAGRGSRLRRWSGRRRTATTPPAGVLSWLRVAEYRLGRPEQSSGSQRKRERRAGAAGWTRLAESSPWPRRAGGAGSSSLSLQLFTASRSAQDVLCHSHRCCTSLSPYRPPLVPLPPPLPLARHSPTLRLTALSSHPPPPALARSPLCPVHDHADPPNSAASPTSPAVATSR